MKDLVCVVADKQIRAAIEGLLQRPSALGIRRVEAEILLHPTHDSGCYANPADILRTARRDAKHALIVLDYAWDGVPAASGAELEERIAERLGRTGLAGWAVPVVIEPELETWVFSDSPHVPEVLGWKGPSSTFRKTLEERDLWKAADAKPADPRAALEYILKRTGRSRSSSLYRRLAGRVNTAGCRDRAFLRLKGLLQDWFPPVPPTSDGGQPGGPSRRVVSCTAHDGPIAPETEDSHLTVDERSTNTVEDEVRTRRKLIEVALPLDDINAASAREKSIRHGHPSTLHLWWARRPLAAARAVIFAQMVDDPSARVEQFPTEKAQAQERHRLFGVIRELVRWENTTNETVLEEAREEIRESWRRTCIDNADHPRAEDLFDPDRLPAFHDPFAGGGALPLEAQRLGLEAHASDLNPVAVLINKAMIEIPPRFADRPPVNPAARADATVVARTWRGAQGLAEDVRHYGRWMRDEAEKRIGYLYPPVEITPALVRERPDLKPYAGRQLTVIAWLWARTVKSPNPAFADVDVPLASTFMLSTKKGREAYVEPVIEGRGYRFTVKVGAPPDAAAARAGTKPSRGANFRCLMTGSPITGDYIKAEGQAGRMGARLMAIVAEGDSGRVYLTPTVDQEETATRATPEWAPDVEFFPQALGFRVGNYGMTKWSDLFTRRQTVALTTFSDLVTEACERVERDCRAQRAGPLAGAGADEQGGASDAVPTGQDASADMSASWRFPADPGGVAAGEASGNADPPDPPDPPDDDRPLRDGGTGAAAYADAVSLYLALAVDKIADRNSSICSWASLREHARNTFGRQALPMVWDFAESNPFSDSSGNFEGGIATIASGLGGIDPGVAGNARQLDAQLQRYVDGVVSTDPPYYDNIGYADLSDFFYVWLRRMLRTIFPDLFATLAVPKAEELVATPYRLGSREKAEAFFLNGMARAMRCLAEQTHVAFPVTIYYAFKQAEAAKDGGIASTGWDTFLDAAIRAGFAITGTWPVRTELGRRLRGMASNALASSIVLVCRRRPADAPLATRREFLAALRSELPRALVDLQTSNIAPVDFAQAAIGPGMAIFTRHAQVLEADGAPMSVRAALLEINRVLDETLVRQESDLDPDTRFCLAWYEQHGLTERAYGEAEVLFNAKNTSFEGLQRAGVITGGRGRVRLVRRDELAPDWDPATDLRFTDWEGVQHMTRFLTAERGGGVAEAARCVVAMGATRAARTRALAYRLYALADRKRWTEEAGAYNVLVTSWPQIQAEAAQLRAGVGTQAGLAWET